MKRQRIGTGNNKTRVIRTDNDANFT